MKILVTGGSGFVGGETIKLLQKERHEIFNYDLMLGYDIRDLRQLELVTNEYKPDRILHLAAIARFADADANPQLAFETNVIGTANVSKVANKYHVPVVYASTGSVYMPIQQEDKILTEESRALGNSTYGCTKYAGETYIRMVNPHIILRYAHLLGVLKKRHGLIGGFLSRIERGMAPILYGGAQSNDFTFVKDVARANVLALNAEWSVWNNTFNIGTGIEITAQEAGDIVCEIFNYTGPIEKKEMRTVDPMRFWFSVEKAKTMLNFKAEYSYRQGLLDMAKEMGYNIGSEQLGTKKSVEAKRLLKTPRKATSYNTRLRKKNI